MVPLVVSYLVAAAVVSSSGRWTLMAQRPLGWSTLQTRLMLVGVCVLVIAMMSLASMVHPPSSPVNLKRNTPPAQPRQSPQSQSPLLFCCCYEVGECFQKTKNKKQKKKKQQQRGFSVLLLVCVFFSTNAFSLSLSLSFLSDARALTSARVGKETRKRGWSGSE